MSGITFKHHFWEQNTSDVYIEYCWIIINFGSLPENVETKSSIFGKDDKKFQMKISLQNNWYELQIYQQKKKRNVDGNDACSEKEKYCFDFKAFDK